MANVIGIVVLMASTATTAVFVSRRFTPQQAPSALPTTVYVSRAKDLTAAGRVVGSDSAPIRIVMFSDFQCPACRYLEASLDSMRTRWSGTLAVVYRHLPLSNVHAHAFPAAIASECAGSQGRFSEYATLLFQKQDSLGKKPWTSYASEAGVASIAEFSSCLRDSSVAAAVERDRRAADAMGFSGTPTFVIGDSAYAAIAPRQLDSLIRWYARREGVALRN